MIKKISDAAAPKRVGVWIRVSTEDQAQGESPQHHELRGRNYAEARGWRVVEVYHLEAVSGKSVMAHPEAVRMMRDVERGHITGLVFSKLARLARNTKELLDFSDYFQTHGADLVSLQESIDTSSPAGRLFYTLLAAMAQWEREEIGSRVAASIPIRAKLGKPIGGRAPYGYQWKDRKLVPHPEEAPVRKLAYELFREEKRRLTVAHRLNEMGYRTRDGRPFQRHTIEYMIKDPTAKGIRRANYSKRVGGKKGWEYKPESDWVLTECEPVVSEELWNSCNAILASQRAKAKPAPKRAVQLFGGLTWCGLCGGKMYVKSNTPKYVCWTCSNRIAVVDLEDIFVSELKKFFLSPVEIEKYLERAHETLQEKLKLVGVLEQERVKVRKEMDHVFDLSLKGRITDDQFQDRFHPHEERIAQLKEEIPRLQAEVDFLKVDLMSKDEILHQASDLYGQWPVLTHESKRAVVESITRRITIGKEDIEIELEFLPVSHKRTKSSDADPPIGSGSGSDRKRRSSAVKSMTYVPYFLGNGAIAAPTQCGRSPAGAADRRFRVPHRG